MNCGILEFSLQPLHQSRRQLFLETSNHEFGSVVVVVVVVVALHLVRLSTTTSPLLPLRLFLFTTYTMAARAAAVDLAKISNLGLGKNTLAQISAFRKRADDAKRQLAQLKQQNTDIDFAHYSNVLRNKDVVSQAQKILSEFKPVTYDVQAQLKAIDAFESKAVSIFAAVTARLATSTVSFVLLYRIASHCTA